MARAKKPASTPAPIERYFVAGDRFWTCGLDGKVVRTRSGKIGNVGRASSKSHAAEWAARRDLQEQVRVKIREGFVEQASATPPPAPRHDARLAAAIAANPTDDTAYLVYADWLQTHGDPRGELIALQAAGKDREARAFLARHADALLGPLAPHQHCYDGFHGKPRPAFVWKNGFIHAARLAHNMHAGHWRGKLATDVLEPLLRHPSGQFLVELTLNENDDPTEDTLDDLFEVIANREIPTLRRLRIGDDISQISWYRVGDLGPIWRALPNLTHFEIEAGEFALGTIHAPNAVRAVFRTGGLQAASARAIAKAAWPALEHLEVYVGDPEYGADATLDDLLPLLTRDDLPALRYLGLKNAVFQRELIAPLAASKLVRQLHTLDLSHGILTDDDVPLLREHARAFRHLEVLDVGATVLSDAGVAKLAGVARRVIAKDRWKDDGELRFVRIGE